MILKLIESTPVAPLRVTGTVIVSPGLMVKSSAMAIEKSSLKIVPVAVPVVIVALLGLDKVTVKVSSGSTTVSPWTLTVAYG